MIEKELSRVVAEHRERGATDLYICNALKEYLQIFVLYFIYTAPRYRKNLIFTGGTCLRHFFGLERLSVDVDFDCVEPVDINELRTDLLTFFHTRYKYDAVAISLKQRGEQILLKFPVLKQLGLADVDESDLLYVRIDLAALPTTHYAAITTSKSHFGMNYAARHYDLPSLMAGKLHAILTRRHLKGHAQRQVVKGRDYFDLLWFVKNGVRPNMVRLSDMLSEELTVQVLETRVDKKVAEFFQRHKTDFADDMQSLIRDPEILSTYVGHYQEEYLRSKARSFSRSITLEVMCQRCRKGFPAGIAIEQHVFATITTMTNTHQCPFCQYLNVVQKGDYVVHAMEE